VGRGCVLAKGREKELSGRRLSRSRFDTTIGILPIGESRDCLAPSVDRGVSGVSFLSKTSSGVATNGDISGDCFEWLTGCMLDLGAATICMDCRACCGIAARACNSSGDSVKTWLARTLGDKSLTSDCSLPRDGTVNGDDHWLLGPLPNESTREWRCPLCWLPVESVSCS
jgi:hypothetical protein